MFLDYDSIFHLEIPLYVTSAGKPDRRSVNALQPGRFAGLQLFVCAVRGLVSDLYVRRVQRTVIQNVIQVCISVVETIYIFRGRRRVG